ncbi:hypothetical protein NPIL_628361 [Nephila pilipes]|uniref:Uncharacterized protein n=1 Tax=Nephila pilipes TaxID=299642 RepID=A0A8X6QR33_NEPPI|nr:hypothetical protein NPIL_628361 [Nephila pilipes]
MMSSIKKEFLLLFHGMSSIKFNFNLHLQHAGSGCDYIGVTHSVTGEKLYHLLRKQGLTFESKTTDMAIVDGHIKKILIKFEDIRVQGKIIITEMIVQKMPDEIEVSSLLTF